MRRLMGAALFAGALASSGCGAVLSNAPTLTNTNGDAWYTEGTGFMGMFWGSHVYYCPAPQAGPAECHEAKYVELPKESK